MQSATTLAYHQPRWIWIGRVLSGLSAAFLFLDALGKFIKPAQVVEGTIRLGYPESAIIGIGMTLLVCTILYVIPRTSVFGAILITGYLGGAVATHVRVGDPVFSIVFPFIVAAFVWGGLYIRDARLRTLVPFRS